MSYQQGQAHSESYKTETAKVVKTEEIDDAGKEHHGLRDTIKDKYEHADKKKLAIGAAVGAAAIGAAIAGGIAIKHHHDEKKRAEELAEGTTVTTTTVTTSETTSIFDSYALTSGQADKKVRIGNKICLKSAKTSRFLSLSKDNIRSSISKRFLCHASPKKTENEYFQVLPGSKGGVNGTVLKFGDVIRVRSVEHKSMLHAQTNKHSSIQGHFEVSGYDKTDLYDDWVVESCSGQTGEVTSDSSIRFRHAQTNNYLHISETKVAGSTHEYTEVTTSSSHTEESAKWNITF